MEQEAKNKKGLKWYEWVGIVLGLFILFSFFIAVFFPSNGGGVQKQTAQMMEDIKAKVVEDAVNQYRIAERQGNKIQICVQAMQVSAAYLQAQNEASYNNWKEIEKMDCVRAGMPQ